MAVADALHVSCGAIAGVLAREGFSHLFGPEVAAIVSSSSALFLDLPSNAVGSFLAGLTAHFKHQIVEVHESIHLALSAGFLGSVTTFASWNLQVTRMFAAGDWIAAFFALFIGVQVSVSAYTFGNDCGSGFSFLASVGGKRSWLHDFFGISGRKRGRISLGDISTSRTEETEVVQTGRIETDDGISSSIRHGRPAASCTMSRVANRYSHSVAVYGPLLILLLLVSGLTTLLVLDKNQSRREIWLSCLIAPLGAILRWQLSRLNKVCAMFPVGTFTANIAATVFDDVLASLLLRLSFKGRWGRTVLEALITGLGGTLSTVSTWCGEIVMLREQSRTRAWSYAYLIISILTSQIFGIVIFGSAKWSQ